MFADNSVGLGFLYPVSYIKSIPTLENFQVSLSTYSIFAWVGLAVGWGVRRFRNNTDMFSNPTEFGKWQTPYVSTPRFTK